jgi:hypothetical protein
MKANSVETKYTHFIFNEDTFNKNFPEYDNKTQSIQRKANITLLNSYHNNGSLNQVIHSFKSSKIENNNSLHFVNNVNNAFDSSRLSETSKVKLVYNVEPSNTEKLKNKFKLNKIVEIDYSKYN